ncbi:hypothetical protein BKA65DRAFT_167701 [Rhexocercosporidium sp. MPI-PUGE-AT-0058]|nr:hypothetical protein BKA65DRAFT_167701 [Rhexocercosporidium sp. MPI-PUGE-AT-0058]
MKRTASMDWGDKKAPLTTLYDRGAKPEAYTVQEQNQVDEDDELDPEVRKALVSASHFRFVANFQQFVTNWIPPNKDSDCVQSFFNEQKTDPKKAQKLKYNIQCAGEEGPDAYKTILHLILKREDPPLETRLPLLRWVMTTYGDLYKVGVEDKNSILHTAVAIWKSPKPQDDALRHLVNLFPQQTCQLLNESPDKDELFGSIMPFIRSCPHSEFLELFGRPPEERAAHRCCCQFCQEPSQVKVRHSHVGAQTNGERKGQVMVKGSTWAGRHVIETKVNNVVTLKYTQIPPQSPFTSSVSTTPASFQKGATRDGGNTLLHLAAQYEDMLENESQLKMVEIVYSQHPEALEVTNDLGRSPYLHRISAYNADIKKVRDDRIAFFLKDRIMHIHNHDTILDLLYGRGQVNKGPGEETPAQAPSDRGQSREFDEREIHLDLREVQISGLSTDRKSLLNFLNGRDFEDILQYVQIPRRPFRSDTTQQGQQAVDGLGTAPPVIGAGRSDFQEIFDLLYGKGVRKIVQLIVDDDEECPHRDDVIEAVAKFSVEVFDWRKIDLSSTVLKVAAANSTQLHLFCSGSECVLRDWSSCDGLKQLKSLTSIQLTIYWRVESRERTKQYAYDFIYRMWKNYPQVHEIEVRIEALTSRSREKWDHGSGLAADLWVSHMQKFTGFLANLQQILPPREPVRVAVLDDGVDWAYTNTTETLWKGISFFVEKRRHFDQQNPWFFSSAGHGTLMARLIHELCPTADLYIARLDQNISESGHFQPTAESAINAIHWAINKKVHIISMSWTIPDVLDANVSGRLEAAVKRARAANILMFGSASDRGAHGPTQPFMSKMSSEGVICIGGAREAGYGDDASKEEGEFFFPGETKGIAHLLDIGMPSTSNQDKFGSSIATALASGFAALLMLLVEMCTLGPKDIGITVQELRQGLQSADNIKRIFRSMSVNNRTDSQNQRFDKVIQVSDAFPNNWGDSIMALTKKEDKQAKLNGLVDDIVPPNLLRDLRKEKDKSNERNE